MKLDISNPILDILLTNKLYAYLKYQLTILYIRYLIFHIRYFIYHE